MTLIPIETWGSRRYDAEAPGPKPHRTALMSNVGTCATLVRRHSPAIFKTYREPAPHYGETLASMTYNSPISLSDRCPDV
ncbi:hypothetical protein NDU88_005869 [Pleurodeles waltl]|uniref:Uncharacterized protein n=1 Tax=Pleurodeles waltl TaxID=8319 RepID=A0AAV7QM94_PLEWA|nr:hypothetical protein NDU88_005869 [Pleurodeles waltl]